MNRYASVPYRRSDTGTRYYKFIKYPLIPRASSDLYAITTEGDRYDILADQFYNDSSLWWVISLANSTDYPQSSLYPPIGVQIRIPQEIQPIISAYKALNQ